MLHMIPAIMRINMAAKLQDNDQKHDFACNYGTGMKNLSVSRSETGRSIARHVS